MTDWWQGFLWGLGIAWLFSSSVTAFVLVLLGGAGERPRAAPAGAAWRVRRAGVRETVAEVAALNSAAQQDSVAVADASLAEGGSPSPFKVSPVTR